MRGQRRGVTRPWRAVAAVVLLTGALTACSSAADEPQVSPTVPRAPAGGLAAAAAPKAASGPKAAAPKAASGPTALPGWWPAVLPVPERASVIAVRPRACSVTFLDWGTDALLAAADLELEAQARGLETRVASSVSHTDPVEQTSELDLADGVAAAPVVTHVVVLRMSRAAAAGESAVNASLILTSRTGGGVSGEYALGGGC